MATSAPCAPSSPRCGLAWQCPLACGVRYARSSGRSIRRHVALCFRAHTSGAQSLSDEQLSTLISEQQDSGQPFTGLRRWRMRQPRRLAVELSDDDRWDCVWGCGKSYRATSGRSIQQHANRCSLRADGRRSDVDVKELQERRMQQQRKKRRACETFDSAADHSSDDDGGEAEAEVGSSNGRSSTASSTASSHSHLHLKGTDYSVSQSHSPAVRCSFATSHPATYAQQVEQVGVAGGEQPTCDGQERSSWTADCTPTAAAHEQSCSQQQQAHDSTCPQQWQYQTREQVQSAAGQTAEHPPRPSAAARSERLSSPALPGWPALSPSATAAPLSSFVSSPSSCDSLLPSPLPQQLSWLFSASSLPLDTACRLHSFSPLPPSLSVPSPATLTTWQITPPCLRPAYFQVSFGVPAAAQNDPTAPSAAAPHEATSCIDTDAAGAASDATTHSLSFTSSTSLPAAWPSTAAADMHHPAASRLSALPSGFYSPTAAVQRDAHSPRSSALHEAERRVSKELCTLLASLYSRYGLHHPVFQQHALLPSLLQRAMALSELSTTLQ